MSRFWQHESPFPSVVSLLSTGVTFAERFSPKLPSGFEFISQQRIFGNQNPQRRRLWILTSFVIKMPWTVKPNTNDLCTWWTDRNRERNDQGPALVNYVDIEEDFLSHGLKCWKQSYREQTVVVSWSVQDVEGLYELTLHYVFLSCRPVYL